MIEDTKGNIASYHPLKPSPYSLRGHQAAHRRSRFHENQDSPSGKSIQARDCNRLGGMQYGDPPHAIYFACHHATKAELIPRPHDTALPHNPCPVNFACGAS